MDLRIPCYENPTLIILLNLVKANNSKSNSPSGPYPHQRSQSETFPEYTKSNKVPPNGRRLNNIQPHYYYTRLYATYPRSETRSFTDVIANHIRKLFCIHPLAYYRGGVVSPTGTSPRLPVRPSTKRAALPIML